MLYVGYPLSLRNVEDLFFEREYEFCHETVRLWWKRVRPMFAEKIRRRRVNHMRDVQYWRWHPDDMYVKMERRDGLSLARGWLKVAIRLDCQDHCAVENRLMGDGTIREVIHVRGAVEVRRCERVFDGNVAGIILLDMDILLTSVQREVVHIILHRSADEAPFQNRDASCVMLATIALIASERSSAPFFATILPIRLPLEGLVE